MRMRDKLAWFILGGTWIKLELSFGWDELRSPTIILISALIMLALIYGGGALYDRFMAITLRSADHD